jgi:hypothetical protein
VDQRNIIEGRRRRQPRNDPRKNPRYHYDEVVAKREELWGAFDDFYEELDELTNTNEKNRLLRDRPLLWERLCAVENAVFDAKEQLVIAASFSDKEVRANSQLVKKLDIAWRNVMKVISQHKSCTPDVLATLSDVRLKGETTFLQTLDRLQAGQTVVPCSTNDDDDDDDDVNDDVDDDEEDDDEDEDDVEDVDDEFDPDHQDEDEENEEDDDDGEEEEEEEEDSFDDDEESDDDDEND